MRRGSQRIGESELSGSLHSQGNYHFRQRRRMESGGAVYQLSQRKLQEVVASLDAGGTTLASGGGHSSTSLPSSSWLGASKPIQEGPESGVDDGAQSTLENPAHRITNATDLPGRQLTGASLFKYFKYFSYIENFKYFIYKKNNSNI